MGSYPIPHTPDFNEVCAAGTDLVRALDAKCETVCQAARLAHVESLAEGGWQGRLVLRVRRVDGLDMSIVFIGSKCVPTYTLKDTSDPYPRYQSKNS